MDDKEKKDIKPVASGKIKKKSSLTKIADVFLSEDRKNVKDYITKDVLIPNLKDLFFKIFTGGLSMIMFGDTEHGKKKENSLSAYKYNYSGIYSGSGNRTDSRPTTRTDTTYYYDDVIFETRGDAERVRDCLDEMIERFGLVSVAEFYDLSEVPNKWTDYNYGWKNLDSVTIERVSGGYIINLPKAIPLK